jgi:hypothetical protein
MRLLRACGFACATLIAFAVENFNSATYVLQMYGTIRRIKETV